MASLQIGHRVEVTGKGVQGEVAYLGTTGFATGKWVGVILDEPKGKNNGTVQGKNYFQCRENYGMFVRQAQLTIIDEFGNRVEVLQSGASPAYSTATSPDDPPRSGLRSRLSSSRQSLSSRSRGDYQSREDVTMSAAPTQHISEPPSKRASFIEKFSTATPSRLPTFKFTTPRRSLAVPSKSLNYINTPQTGFVETLKPQFTPGQVLASPSTSQSQTPATRPPPPPPVDPEELDNLKSQVQDLGEKLETIKMKYKEKTHEVEQLKIQLDQAQEFKLKMLEAQATLKKELERARRETERANEAKEEMSDIAETLELITLDKEMAEEKVESLQLELDQAKEKLEELTLDYQLLKEEMSEKRGDTDQNVPTSYEMRQLEQQNARLRDTLVRMRDLAAHEKHEMLKLTRDLEAKKTENADLTKTNDKLIARTSELENQITDLHEQVDAALGAEEMVEQLGLQKLTLEDRLKELEETIADLEALQEVNDQLQEDSRDLEMDLREESDLAHAATREALRQKEAILESLADRELTIVKFRELVNKLQEQNQDLRLQLEKESSNKSSVAQVLPEMLDFKKMFAESKAHARAIDLELRRMEVQQSQQHVQYLAAFMPESFMNRGGDNDAVLVLLLFPRLLWKCEVLLSQLKDKFPSVTAAISSEVLMQGHAVQQYTARCYLAMHLHSLQAILRQFHDGLNSCSPETLLKVGASYPDMAQQERALDGYIDLHKRDQLDENVNSDSLEKCVNYFVTMHPLLLLASGETKVHQGHLVNDLGKALQAACDSIHTDTTTIQALIKVGPEPTDMQLLCQHLSTVSEVASQHLKQIRRRLAIFDSDTLPLPPAMDLPQCCQQLARVTKLTREVAKAALSQVGNSADGEAGVDVAKLSEALASAWERLFDNDNIGPIASIKAAAASVAGTVAQVAQALLDSEPAVQLAKEDKAMPPITVRAQQVKSELEETKALRARLESREADIRELKMSLRSKQEELGELQVRKDLAEKRLANQSREDKMAIEKLERKLEEAQKQMQRKEKEFEETMDHLQADIDSLESERGELKDKLKNYSKKVFIEGVKSSVVNASLSTSQNTSVRESPLLLNEIRSLKLALKNEQSEKFKLQVDHMKNQLDQLKPLNIPKRKSTEELEHLTSEAQTLLSDIRKHMLPTVVDISKRRPGERSLDPANHIVRRMQQEKLLQRRVTKLQDEVMSEIVKRKRGGKVETDLAIFPTPEMTKALAETEPVVIGELTLPRTENDSKDVVPVYLDSIACLKQLQEKLLTLTVGS
uniref:Dynactin subunit 1 n=1 Tax=Graphocephala atropunctata TaxID=36148 RepID=A0A1B6KU69_9HEMI